MITFDFQSENLLSILGALFDIAGALTLGWTLAFAKPDAIQQQSGTYWGSSPPLIKFFSEQKVDAGFGLLLLVRGFTIQGAAGWGFKTTSLAVLLTNIVGLVAMCVSYYAIRKRLTERSFKRALRTAVKEDGSPEWTEEQIQNHWAKL